MFESDLVNLGAGAAVALFLIKQFAEFALKMAELLKKRANGGSDSKASVVPMSPTMAQGVKDLERDFLHPIKRMVKELHDWHNVTDRDGVKIWYVRPSLAEAIRDLSVNISTQTDVLKEMLRLQHQTIDKLEE